MRPARPARLPPDDEITPTATDEGAGWEAAVEAAQAATPLIGEAQTKAVERINAYFNNITNLQGSFEQVDATNKRSTGRFYVQRPGKIRFDYAPPSGLRIVADGSSLAIEDSDLRTVEKYPIQSTPFRLLLSDSVDLAAMPASSGSRARKARSPFRSRTNRATRPAPSGSCSTAAPSSN